MNLKFNKFTILGIIAALVLVGVIVYTVKELRAAKELQKSHAEAITKIASIVKVNQDKTGQEMVDIKTRLNRVTEDQPSTAEKIEVVPSKEKIFQRHHEIKEDGEEFNPFKEVTDPDQVQEVTDNEDEDLSPEKLEEMSRDILD